MSKDTRYSSGAIVILTVRQVSFVGLSHNFRHIGRHVQPRFAKSFSVVVRRIELERRKFVALFP